MTGHSELTFAPRFRLLTGGMEASGHEQEVTSKNQTHHDQIRSARARSGARQSRAVVLRGFMKGPISVPEGAFGVKLRRSVPLVSITSDSVFPFHIGNTGSNSVGDGPAFGAVPRVFKRTGSFERFSACAWKGRTHLED